MNINMEKMSNKPKTKIITDALLKLKKAPAKDGLNLLDIAKKISSKKFGKK